MPRCPNCGYDYRGHLKLCPECGQELAAAPPARRVPGKHGGPGPECVPLLTLSDPAEAMVLRATLDEAGIPVIMETRCPITAELAVVAEDISDDYAVLLVPPDRLAGAQQLLESLRRDPPQWPPGLEPEDGDEREGSS